MTQPGVSQHIKKLEQACGVPLIQRVNKSFELTDAGKEVYRYVVAQQQQEKALRSLITGDDPWAGKVRISCSGAMAQKLYPMLLDLQCKHPKLINELEVAPTSRILEHIVNGELDFGIVTEKPNHPLLLSKHIGHEYMSLVLPSMFDSHLLTVDSLNQLGLINHPDAHHYLCLYFEQCGNTELLNTDPSTIRQSGYINQLNQILLPVTKGLGFTVLPHSAVESAALKDKLTIYQPQKQVREPVYLVCKKHRQQPARFYSVTEKIQTLLAGDQ